MESRTLSKGMHLSYHGFRIIDLVLSFELDDTLKDDNLHYPSHSSRIQLGIWDASNPAGTAKWAKGPIDWRKAPSRISATFSSVEIECPY